MKQRRMYHVIVHCGVVFLCLLTVSSGAVAYSGTLPSVGSTSISDPDSVGDEPTLRIQSERQRVQDACDGYEGRTCKKREALYLTHGIHYFNRWKRCLAWEFRATLEWALHKIGHRDPAATAEDLIIRRPRLHVWVNRYCDDDRPNRRLGGLTVRPSVVASRMPPSTDAGGCGFEPSFSVSYPWGASISLTPTCDHRIRVATMKYSGTISRKSSHYFFGVSQPRKFRVRYNDLYVLLNGGPIMCLRTRISGSAQHVRRPASLAFKTRDGDCFSLRRGG